LPSQPPANCGSTSTTAASPSTRSAALRRPAGAPSTRKDDVASTERSRLASPCRAMTAARASASVSACTDSAVTPAASLAAAQYLMVTLAISRYPVLQRDPGAVAPGSLSVYTSTPLSKQTPDRPHKQVEVPPG